MANDAAALRPACVNIEVLVFSLRGITLAIDGEQVDRLMALEEADRENLALEWLHRKFNFAENEVNYKQPRVITLAGNENLVGLVIDQPHDFMTVGIEAIRPLPAIFKKRQALQPFWGAYLDNNKIILLIDFFKLVG